MFDIFISPNLLLINRILDGCDIYIGNYPIRVFI